MRAGDWAEDVPVVIRRARVVSEPVSQYIAFEHSGSFTNAAAGEQIRRLPRRLASDLALPGNDFWLFDGRLAQFNISDGEGRWTHTDRTDDPGVTALCASAFEAVWERGIPHEEYRV
ncbi:DUF6879 family protein [Streptomyces sp. NPDC001985]|uniref:DUF6879 family protein n=1 Tax=Streptomyces sp. NPDC001985 TaxID=3154406 RepID=UPI00332FE2FC